MEDGERKFADASRISGVNQVKRHGLLNKFLTKTYHMIDTCDPLIAGWSEDGESFEILDVKEFSKSILPKFFKHSKFPSFVRQLNFYSFRKLRQSQTTETRSVRFGHKWFQRGCPELLHNIQRITKASQESSSSSSSSGTSELVKSLKEEMSQTHKALADFRVRMDQQFQQTQTAVEMDFQQRMAGFSLSYQLISNIALQVAQVQQQQNQQQQEQHLQSLKLQDLVSDTQLSSAGELHASTHVHSKDLESESPSSRYYLPTAPSPSPAAVLSSHHHETQQRMGATGTAAVPGGTRSPTSVAFTQEVILGKASKITKGRGAESFPKAPMCPLMALSMVASLDHQQEFGDYEQSHPRQHSFKQ